MGPAAARRRGLDVHQPGFQRADAFLFGRRTYEIFAGFWEAGMDPGNPVGEALNTRPKYVASTTLTNPQWAGTTVLSGDVAAAVGELRAEPGGELQVWGSGTLIRWLLDHRLVDEIVLLTYPVVVGQGTRLFPATGPDTGLELVDLRSTPKGLTIQTYRTTVLGSAGGFSFTQPAGRVVAGFGCLPWSSAVPGGRAR
jgi:dihydrofolate reductase